MHQYNNRRFCNIAEHNENHEVPMKKKYDNSKSVHRAPRENYPVRYEIEERTLRYHNAT